MSEYPRADKIENIPFNPDLPTDLQPTTVGEGDKEKWIHDISQTPYVVTAYFTFKAKQEEVLESGEEVDNEKILAELKAEANPLERVSYDKVYEHLQELDHVFELFAEAYPNLFKEIKSFAQMQRQIAIAKKGLEKDFGRDSTEVSGFRSLSTSLRNDPSTRRHRLSMMLDGIHYLDPQFDINIFVR